jgi:hypothetical protein
MFHQAIRAERRYTMKKLLITVAVPPKDENALGLKARMSRAINTVKGKMPVQVRFVEADRREAADIISSGEPT